MPRRTKPAPMPVMKNFKCPVCSKVTDTPYRKHVVLDSISDEQYEEKTPRASMKHVKEYYYCSHACSLKVDTSTTHPTYDWS